MNTAERARQFVGEAREAVGYGRRTRDKVLMLLRFAMDELDKLEAELEAARKEAQERVFTVHVLQTSGNDMVVGQK